MTLEWNDRKFVAELTGKIVQNMERAVEFAADQARGHAPRATGGLVRGVDIAVEAGRGKLEVTGWVGVKKGIIHAWFQEMGTRKMAAHPFLRPAVFGNAARIVGIIEGKE